MRSQSFTAADVVPFGGRKMTFRYFEMIEFILSYLENTVPHKPVLGGGASVAHFSIWPEHFS